MPLWTFESQAAVEIAGIIPTFLYDIDPRPAREQFNDRYAHGGGWRPMDNWQLIPPLSIQYPGEPLLRPLAITKLREETIAVYLHAWVMIMQPDGSFEVARMD